MSIGKFALYQGKVLRVKKIIVRTVLLLIASVCAWAQPSNNSSPVEFHVYRIDERLRLHQSRNINNQSFGENLRENCGTNL